MNLDELAEGRTLQVAGTDLPPGRLVRPRLTSPVSGNPVLWATNEPLSNPGEQWLTLSEAAPDLGLIPVILDVLERSDPGRPWDSGELDPHTSPRPDDLDEATVFRQRWNMSVPVGLLPAEDRPPPLQLPGRPSRPVFEEEYEEDPEERDIFLELVAPWGVGFPGAGLGRANRGRR